MSFFVFRFSCLGRDQIFTSRYAVIRNKRVRDSESQLYTVCKDRAYPGSTRPGLSHIPDIIFEASPDQTADPVRSVLDLRTCAKVTRKHNA